jgi:hypothetical protein
LSATATVMKCPVDKTPVVAPLPTFDLQRTRAARLHVLHASAQAMSSTHLALLALHDPSFRALSADAAAFVLRKSQARIQRKLRQSLER